MNAAVGQRAPVAPVNLAPAQIMALLADTSFYQVRISLPVASAYAYADKTGRYYCLLLQSNDSVTPHNDTLHRHLEAIAVRVDKGACTKLWCLTDHIISNENAEYSIGFWPSYTSLVDIDGDGQADPILVYGTEAENQDNGRIKIICYHRGKKVAIRHQNGVLDGDRVMQVDAAFYDLPSTIQNHIKGMMERMTASQTTIFPAGWRAAMQRRKTTIREPRYIN